MTTASSMHRRKTQRTAARARQPPSIVPRAAALEGRDEEGTDLDRALTVMAAARRVLLDAQVALEAILRDRTDPAEQAAAGAGLLDIERELQLLENRRRVLVDGTATLNPPSGDDVAAAERVATDLGAVIAANGKAAAMIGLVADAVRLGEKLGG